MSIKNISLPMKFTVAAITIALIISGIVFSNDGKNNTTDLAKDNASVTVFSLSNDNEDSVAAITSGEIESLEQVELSSEIFGTVTSINASIGDKVSSGQTLVQFRATDKMAQLAQAQAEYENTLGAKASLLAQIDTAKANHKKLLLAVQSKIASAETVVLKSNNNLTQNAPLETMDIIPNAYNDAFVFLTSIQDTLSKRLISADNILGIDNAYVNYKFKNLLGVQDISSLNQSNQSYYDSKQSNSNFFDYLNNIYTSDEQSKIDTALSMADDSLLMIKKLFLDLSLLLDNTITDINFSQSELDGLIANINIGREDVTSKRTQLINIMQSLQNAKSTKDTRTITNSKNITDLEITYEKALGDLEDAKKQAQAEINASSAAIKQLETNLISQEASTKRALASISAVKAELAKTAIKSPIDGTVASINAKIGELISNGKIVAEVVNTEGLQIKTFVSGNALPFISVGGAVLVEDNPVGKILRISPSINQTTKKVEIIVSITQMDNTNFLVGQFVELKIIGNKELKDNQPVLVPLQAVKINANSHEVFIINENSAVEAITVETGKLIGDQIEIISDLSNYDAIISPVRGIEIGQLVSINQ